MPRISTDPAVLADEMRPPVSRGDGGEPAPSAARGHSSDGGAPSPRLTAHVLPEDPATRKRIPLASGCFDYFEAALAEVARVSWIGNEKHNPGEPIHHSREKSNDHPDALLRHFLDRGKIDTVTLPDGRVFQIRASAEMAWRALAILQEELEAAGAPLARGARVHR